MTRFILDVNRRSPAWTNFEARNAPDLPKNIQNDLKKLEFEPDVFNDPTSKTWTCSMHHRGHAPYQWSFAVDLMAIGYNFLNDHERDQCKQGETALMELIVKESTVDYTSESHGSNLTLKISQQE
mmetsp:Transcript_53390/g.129886  ORF Transcript_53390/g.129886 Transcript_53390/m.129886 type:complete len:125 (+) Transcript_53390:2657-3031(+)|eukprot:CAMPEP_0113442600 /NCGR_PEP_ID=MMETSP0014_2-20120614/1697_1 /TAXON_ID=2857 /ORGANISM="Nitzschia sp." /LENGTH=124 /DNA_ID=CAMNT_0000333511 /DNA_START=264 /DNA_END=638 /DNA_ORIENTATION=- /assembly_acc=CAM_ASM_000159